MRLFNSTMLKLTVANFILLAYLVKGTYIAVADPGFHVGGGAQKSFFSKNKSWRAKKKRSSKFSQNPAFK